MAIQPGECNMGGGTRQPHGVPAAPMGFRHPQSLTRGRAMAHCDDDPHPLTAVGTPSHANVWGLWATRHRASRADRLRRNRGFGSSVRDPFTAPASTTGVAQGTSRVAARSFSERRHRWRPKYVEPGYPPRHETVATCRSGSDVPLEAAAQPNRPCTAQRPSRADV